MQTKAAGRLGLDSGSRGAGSVPRPRTAGRAARSPALSPPASRRPGALGAGAGRRRGGGSFTAPGPQRPRLRAALCARAGAGAGRAGDGTAAAGGGPRQPPGGRRTPIGAAPRSRAGRGQLLPAPTLTPPPRGPRSRRLRPRGRRPGSSGPCAPRPLLHAVPASSATALHPRGAVKCLGDSRRKEAELTANFSFNV